MAQVPLRVELITPITNSTAVSLNDGVNFSVVRFGRTLNTLVSSAITLFDDIEDSITLNIIGSGYQQVQNNLNMLARYATSSQFGSIRGVTSQQMILTVTPSGLLPSQAGYGCAIKELRIELPEDNLNLSILRSIPNVKLTYKRSEWYNLLDASFISAGRSTVSTNTTIPGIFTVSGLPTTYYTSPISVYVAGMTYAQQRMTPSGYIAVTNDPWGFNIIDLTRDATVHAAFTTVTETTALGGNVIRFSSGALNSQATYTATVTNDSFPAALAGYRQHDKVHVFGAIRCSGTWAINAGLTDTYSSITNATTWADTQYTNNLQYPTVVYLGTITSNRYINGYPTYKLTALSASGYLDIDYLAFIGDGDDNTSVLRVEPVSLSGITSGGGVAIMQNPYGRLYGGSELGTYTRPNVFFAVYNNGVSKGTIATDVGSNSITNQFIIPYRGNPYLRWKSYTYNNAPETTSFTSVEGYAYTMYLATGSGGQWSYTNISGAALSLTCQMGIHQAYPYMPRI